MTRWVLALGGLLAAGMTGTRTAVAQDTPPAGWQFMIVPYILFPHMNGTVGVGPVEAAVDATPSDVFSNLQFGAMLAAEAKRGPWAIGFNGLYMDLGKEKEVVTAPGGPALSGQLGVDQGAIELTGFRALAPWVEVLAGGRVNFLGASIDVQAPNQSFSRDADRTWFDPFLGVRLTAPDTGKWRFSGRGDVGGFGVGSDFTWQVRVVAGYRVSRLIELGLGYWAIGIDYTSDTPVGEFTYDMTTFGPQVGVAFHF
jgi:hypothetical protein